MKYDLEERTARFGEEIIEFLKKIKPTIINQSLIKQLVRSATSVGANYMEANGASSKRDFKNKIHLCKKEAKETMHWLRMISKTNPELKEKARILWQEIQELSMIFNKIVQTINKK